MNRRVPAVAAISSEAFAVGTAARYLAANDWFGVEDLPALVAWSVPLAALVYFSFRAATRRMAAPTALPYLVLPLIGAVLGFLWTIFVSLILGGWIIAFSFPVLVCWVLAGLLAGVVAALLLSPKLWPAGIALPALALFALSRINDYAQPAQTNLLVVLAPGLSTDDVNRFWQEVIGHPDPHPGEHSLLEGITAASVISYEHGSPVVAVNLARHITTDQRDSILATIRKSRLVRSAEVMAPMKVVRAIGKTTTNQPIGP